MKLPLNIFEEVKDLACLGASMHITTVCFAHNQTSKLKWESTLERGSIDPGWAFCNDLK